MQQLNRSTIKTGPVFSERVLQFGGGNFLRAFVDWMLDVYNEKTNSDVGVLLVTPIERDNYKKWQEQDGLYHVLTRGFQQGRTVDESHLVKSISRILHLYPHWDDYLKSAEQPELRFVVSNTTEAGIRFSDKDQVTDTPPNEFPAKLTLWLHHRYQHFKGAPEAGCIMIPVELILKNGEMLQKCILQNADNWALEEGFKKWIRNDNIFCNTLVDRIVPGVGRDALEEEWEKLGFQDTMVTQGEAFHFWVIEGPQTVQEELPLDKAGLNVIFTDDLTPYRTRKVRILNGAHTSMVPVGYLYGTETVRKTVEHEVMGKFVHKAIFEEIIPTLDLPDEELQQYANDVLDRFKNPFIKHQLISIALNSVSKFETRVLPSLLNYYERKGELPVNLVFSLAALIRFYKGEYEGKPVPLNDDADAIAYLSDLWKQCDGSVESISNLADKVLRWEYAWKKDLTSVPGLKALLTEFLLKIEQKGIREAVAEILK